MKQRLIVAAVGLPILVGGTVLLPPWGMAVLAVLILTAGAAELIRVTGSGTVERVYVYTMVSAAAIPMGTCFWTWELTVRCAALFLILALAFEMVFTRGREKCVTFRDAAVCLLGGVGIPLLYSSVVSLRMLDRGAVYVMLGYAITMLSDTGAFFAGKRLGKHRPLPSVSPNKTTEGFIASFLTCIAVVLCFGLVVRWAFSIETDFLALLAYVIPCNLACQIGDLFFSVVKREAGVKDFSTVLPGHGGMYDRFDSQFFTVPVLYLLVLVLPAFGGG